jgi:hypothetical protein
MGLVGLSQNDCQPVSSLDGYDVISYLPRYARDMISASNITDLRPFIAAHCITVNPE